MPHLGLGPLSSAPISALDDETPVPPPIPPVPPPPPRPKERAVVRGGGSAGAYYIPCPPGYRRAWQDGKRVCLPVESKEVAPRESVSLKEPDATPASELIGEAPVELAWFPPDPAPAAFDSSGLNSNVAPASSRARFEDDQALAPEATSTAPPPPPPVAPRETAAPASEPNRKQEPPAPPSAGSNAPAVAVLGLLALGGVALALRSRRTSEPPVAQPVKGRYGAGPKRGPKGAKVAPRARLRENPVRRGFFEPERPETVSESPDRFTVDGQLFRVHWRKGHPYIYARHYEGYKDDGQPIYRDVYCGRIDDDLLDGGDTLAIEDFIRRSWPGGRPRK